MVNEQKYVLVLTPIQISWITIRIICVFFWYFGNSLDSQMIQMMLWNITVRLKKAVSSIEHFAIANRSFLHFWS